MTEEAEDILSEFQSVILRKQRLLDEEKKLLEVLKGLLQSQEPTAQQHNNNNWRTIYDHNTTERRTHALLSTDNFLLHAGKLEHL